MTAGDVVRDFIKANESGDIEAVLAMVTDDIEYENVPMSVMRGKDAIRETMAPFYAGTTKVEWEVLRQIESANEVANERIDRFEIGGKWVEIRVAGFFEVTDGKISFWRDYFDLNSFTKQMS